MTEPPRTELRLNPVKQMVGSILVGLAIVAVTILVVTLKFGSTSVAELEGREDVLKERGDIREEAAEAAEERRENAADRREGDGGSGPG